MYFIFGKKTSKTVAKKSLWRQSKKDICLLLRHCRCREAGEANAGCVSLLTMSHYLPFFKWDLHPTDARDADAYGDDHVLLVLFFLQMGTPSCAGSSMLLRNICCKRLKIS